MKSTSKIRFVFYNTQGGIGHTNVAIAEITVSDTPSGADLCTGGIATASSNLVGYEPAKAVDNVTTTMWNGKFGVGTSWWSYDFGTNVTPVEYSFKARHDGFLNDCPTEWHIQYWTGSAWETIATQSTAATWGLSEIRTFTLASSESSSPSVSLSNSPSVSASSSISSSPSASVSGSLSASISSSPSSTLSSSPSSSGSADPDEEPIDPVWDFIEQTDKYGYQNNPRWTNNPNPDYVHAPCGHWHKGPAAPPEALPMSIGRLIAAREQYNTPYVYLFDTRNFVNYEVYNAVRIDTSLDPPQVVGVVALTGSQTLWPDGRRDRLAVNNSGEGVQRGGYCINKSGTRLFYLLFDIWYAESSPPPTGLLIEVDITPGRNMEVVKSTRIPELLPYGVPVIEMVATDERVYFITGDNMGRFVAIDVATHAVAFNYTYGLAGDSGFMALGFNQDCTLMFSSSEYVDYDVPGDHVYKRHTLGLDGSISTDTIYAQYWSVVFMQEDRKYGTDTVIRNYHPSTGYIELNGHSSSGGYFPGYSSSPGICYNILAYLEEGETIVTLQQNNTFSAETYLMVHKVIGMSAYHSGPNTCDQIYPAARVDTLEVSLYTGSWSAVYHEDYIPINWSGRAVSVGNTLTGKVLIFSFRDGESVGEFEQDFLNWMAVFTPTPKEAIVSDGSGHCPAVSVDTYGMTLDSWTSLEYLWYFPLPEDSIITCNPVWPLDNQEKIRKDGRGYWHKN